MSFGKLLVTGKSLIGSRSAGKYRENKHVSLPKFISPKNPFVPATNKDVMPVQAVAPETPAEYLSPQAAEPVVRAALLNESAPNAARPSVWRRLSHYVGQQGKRWKPIPKSAHRAPDYRPVLPRQGAEPVQGELRLENVRVVRNDLSDADLEVVPGGPAKTGRPVGDSAWRGLSAPALGSEPG